MRLIQERSDFSLLKLLLWIFGANCHFMMLDDHFGSSYEDLHVRLNEHGLGFS